MSFDFDSFSCLLKQFERLKMTLRVEGNELVIRPGGRLMPRAKAFFLENKPAIIAVLRLRHYAKQVRANGYQPADIEHLFLLCRQARRFCGCYLTSDGYPMNVGHRAETRAGLLYDPAKAAAHRAMLEAAQEPLEEDESNHNEAIYERQAA